MLKRLSLHIISMSVLAILAGCGPSKTVQSPSAGYKPGQGSVISNNASVSAPQSAALVDAARSWLGTPYRYGGEDRKGVDCSGLVLKVYKDALGIPLPRNSGEQRDYCTPASIGNLIPGDLIFFATGKNKSKVSHVGIFVGNNQMIHASASKGVIVSSITEPYYSRTYVGSGIVDKYHAMLKDVPAQPEKKPSEPGFTLTPVESLPIAANKPETPAKSETTTASVTTKAEEVKERPAKQPATVRVVTSSPEKKPQTTAKPVTTVQTATISTASSTTNAEPTPEEARASVLSSLKEKDL